MSRIGRKPIIIPTGVTIGIAENIVTVTGPKGKLELQLMSGLALEQTENSLALVKTIENAETLKSYGLMRTLLDNMITGVSQGFQRKLEINGVGYRANITGSTINLSLGFSHPVTFMLPSGIEAKIERNTIILSGFDKQLVGQVAANLRALRKPEPYKGKGIKYAEERIRRKAGKTATKG